MARLDAELVARNIAKSRARASELISAGQISVDGKVCTKASKQVLDTSSITMEGEGLVYVGRGGLKLEKGLAMSNANLTGAVCMDIGASTGGFTDCMLRNGAAKVYAVDVGHGQLDKALANDSRVVNMEGTDVRTLTNEDIPEKIDFISTDVSFISLKLIIPEAARFLKEDGRAVFLIKPQFEAGRENIGKHGIVKSEKVHIRVLDSILQEFSVHGLSLVSLAPSPITGGSGNIEYLAAVVKNNSRAAFADIPGIVKSGFAANNKSREGKA